MTGSGWFDSAHGLQVYHFYPFTPLALRLGVVFVLREFMKSKSYEDFVEKFKPKKPQMTAIRHRWSMKL